MSLTQLARARINAAEQLVACGADFTAADGLGRMPLHEVARLGDYAMELGKFCLMYLKLKDAETLSAALNSVATDGLNQQRATLAEMIFYMHAWYMLPQLVELGMDVHWAPVEERCGMLLKDAVCAVS